MSYITNRLNTAGVPHLSTFQAINAGGRATIVKDEGGILMQVTNGIAADDYRILKRPVPIPPYTFTVHVFPTLWNANYSGCGILWRQSSNGALQVWGVHSYNNAINLLCRNETANNTTASPTFTTSTDIGISPTNNVVSAMGPGLWLQLHDDGTTNRVFRVSMDGLNFVTVVSISRTSVITPDELGLFVGNVNSAGSAPQSSALFDSWIMT